MCHLRCHSKSWFGRALLRPPHIMILHFLVCVFGRRKLFQFCWGHDTLFGSRIWGFVHVIQAGAQLAAEGLPGWEWWVSVLSFMVFRIGTVGAGGNFCEIYSNCWQSSNLNVVLGWFLGGCKWKNTFSNWYLEEFWLITCTTRHMYIKYSTLFLNDTRRDRILEVFKLKSLWQIYLYISRYVNLNNM